MEKTRVEKNLYNALAPVVSSILTNILYDIISTSHFEKKIVNEKELFLEIEKYTTQTQLAIVIISYFLIWFLIAILLPRGVYLINSVRYKHKHVYRTKEIIKRYNRIKETIKSILPIIQTYNQDADYIMIYSDDLAKCINEMHLLFCERNNSKNVFRKSSVVSKGHYISSYEYTALIKSMQKLLLITMSDTQNEACQHDYKELNKKIDALLSIQ